MLKRLAATLLLALAPSVAPLPMVPAAQAQGQPAAIAELLRATALDVVFTQFGATIAAAARTQEISTDEIFVSHWEATAAEVFDATRLHGRLAKALDGRLAATERAELTAFFRSAFGRRITGLERAAALLAPEEQARAIAQGLALSERAPVVRAAQIDALMELVSAEISAAMVGQSVRALLLGLSVSHQRGDIAVPWEEIDAQVKAMMPGVLADVARTQRAMMAYAYRELSDDELDRYLDFLRTPAAQKFYAVAAYAVGRIVTDGMSAFGEAFAARMKSVNV